jgi:hypothetical protein
MPRRAAAGARRGAELRSGLARVRRLEDFAAAARVVERGFARAGAVGQGFRAEHFVEIGVVNARSGSVLAALSPAYGMIQRDPPVTLRGKIPRKLALSIRPFATCGIKGAIWWRGS